jgi:hypothetical protein
MELYSKSLLFSLYGNTYRSISRKLYCLVVILLFINNIYAADSTDSVRYLEYNDLELLQKEKLDSVIGQNKRLMLPEIYELKLSLAPLESNKGFAYIYQLHGFDPEMDTTRASEIRYTNLPGGAYKLEIIACKNDEVLAVYELPFTVFNPIHKQWWFGPLLTFCMLLIPFMIYYFFNLDRSRRILRLESVRNQIASDLHDDIGANLSAIKNFTELIHKKTPKDNASSILIKKTKTYLDETIIGLQDTVWSINPLNDSVELLIEKMQDFAIIMVSAKDIEHQFNNDYNQKTPIILDMDQRHSLLLMFKEVINNIVKHAEASKVNIQISNTKEALQIFVKDNGKGFDTNQQYGGNGLRNFKNRSRQNFIETNIQSELERGTKVRITAHSL